MCENLAPVASRTNAMVSRKRCARGASSGWRTRWQQSRGTRDFFETLPDACRAIGLTQESQGGPVRARGTRLHFRHIGCRFAPVLFSRRRITVKHACLILCFLSMTAAAFAQYSVYD